MNQTPKKKEIVLPPMMDASTADRAIFDMVKARQEAGVEPLDWHIPYLQNTAYPLFPRWTYNICGRSGSMKSTLMSYLIKRWGMDLMIEWEKTKNVRRIGLFYKPEENMEMGRYQTWTTRTWSFVDLVRGSPNLDELEKDIAQQTRPPIIFMGDTESRHLTGSTMLSGGRISTRDIWNACDYIKGGGFMDDKNIDIAFVAIDGLQLLDDEARTKDMVEKMVYVPAELLNIAADFSCPLIFTSQANMKGATDKYDSIPRLSDIQWTTTAAQAIYAHIGIERPIKKPGVTPAVYNPLSGGLEGDTVKVLDDQDKQYQVPITRDLLVALVDKFRFTLNCEGRPIAMWSNAKEGTVTQEKLDLYSPANA